MRKANPARNVACAIRNSMLLPCLWMAVVLLALIATAMSLLFFDGRVYAADRVVEVNPYDDIDWDNVEQYKINLHTHTTESDGRLGPAQVIDEYHARDYHGLAITDHDRCTWPWTDYDRAPGALGMLAIPGNELSRHHHTLSLFCEYETEERDHDKALAGVAEAGGLAILCHPAMHWLREYVHAPCLQAPLAPPLRRMPHGDFTVDAWFRSTDAGRNILLGNYAGSHEGALNLELHTDNRVRLYVQPHGEGRTVDINVSADALGIDTRDGQWHHLAGARRGDTIYLYLDGQPAGQRPDRAGAYELQGDFMFIGRDSRTRDTAFVGDIAQVRFWDRALTPDEIARAATGMPLDQDQLIAQYIASETPSEDTAGHGEGPFHATRIGAPQAQRVEQGPLSAHQAEKGTWALRFGADEFPQTVPDAAVASYTALFERHAHLVGVEVLNRTRPDREYPLDRELWDRLLAALMPQRPVWGVAVDDMHGMQHLGGDWVVLFADALDTDAARDALTTGRYYFASTRLHGSETADAARTPRIERIQHDRNAGTIEVAASIDGELIPEDAFAWIADGRVVHTGPSLAYRAVDAINNYVRLEITGDGGIAYLNPFGFHRQ